MPHSRRDFLKYGSIGLGALALPSYDANSSNHGNLTSNHSLERTIKEYNTQRAWGILSTNGPAAVYKLGFERYIKDSIVEKVSLISGTAAGAYYLANTELGRKITRELTSDSNKLVEHVYEALGSYFSGKLGRRQFIATGLLLSLFACGGNGGGIPPPTGPSPNTTSISTTVADTNGNPVNGVVQYLASDSGPIVAQGKVIDGKSQLDDISGAERIKRGRIIGNDGEIAPFLTQEINLGRFNQGANQINFKVKDRGQYLPFWYDRIIRNVFNPVYNRKPVDEVQFVAELNDNIGIVNGNRLQSIDDRLNITKSALKYISEEILNQPFVDGVTFKTANERQTQGNNVFVIRYQPGVGVPSGGFVIENGRIRGALAWLSLYAPNDLIDTIECATFVRFLGESNELPSLINDPPTTNRMTQPDKDAKAASDLDALMTKSQSTFDGKQIDSFEPPV